MLPCELSDEVKNNFRVFIKKIVDGELLASDIALENSEFMSNPDFETVVMRYAHGDCYQLAATLLLLDHSNALTPYFLRSTQGYCHGLVCFQQGNGTKMFLDSNGLQTEQSVINQWSFLTKGKVDLIRYDREDFLDRIGIEDDEFEDAAYEFSGWISFVLKNNIFGKKPVMQNS